jgi:hypothetical protein
MGNRETTGPRGASLDDLPDLVARLGDDLATLVDGKLGLLKLELREDVSAYVRGALGLAVGGVVALVGVALLGVALALLVAHAIAATGVVTAVRYVLGFLAVGVVYLAVGLAVARYSQQRVAAIEPVTDVTKVVA